MSLLMTTRRPLDPALDALGGATASPTAKTLHYTRWQQEQTQWCWAACAGAVAAYYQSTSHWSQCALVCAELGASACCANGSDDDCDRPWYLDRALSRVGHFESPIVASTLAWDQVVAEVSDDQPVGVRIAWSNGSGHFVVIDGFDATGGKQLVDVQDPFDGQRLISYTKLCTEYPGDSGRWSHSYRTRA